MATQALLSEFVHFLIRDYIKINIFHPLQVLIHHIGIALETIIGVVGQDGKPILGKSGLEEEKICHQDEPQELMV